ncbi:cytochrome c biogenesis protein CcsA [Rosistilla oblonga]|uniref:cytochrome c biogenesis protein CcsA n=1 Tax=Rosistilla oblonga TaxID=2527990 RepID=UPI003A97327E
MQHLSQITVTCFVGSYIVALLLEITRGMFRLPGRMAGVIGFTAAGLYTHVAYLTMSARQQMDGAQMGLLASWYDWTLLLALGVAICYAILLLRRPDSTLGYFLLPLVLSLIGLAGVLRNSAPFSRDEATGFWLNMHAGSMLLVTVAVLLGFVAGVVYLVHSYRLKHKRLSSAGMRLPSLEWLQTVNRVCLLTSTCLMAVGLFAGIAMHLNRSGEIVWTNRGIALSCVLFAWLVIATLFEALYKPARRGRKIAYLTLASFGFLVLAMAGLFTSNHGASGEPPAGKTEATAEATLPGVNPEKGGAV